MNFLILLIIVCTASFAFAFPTLEATNIFDNKVTLLKLENNKKGHVVVFLSSLCPCSNSHIEYLKILHQNNPDFEFIGVHSNADEKADEAQAYFKLAKLPFPVLKDKNSQWANEFKAHRTPHAFILNPQGEILYEGGVTSSSNPAKAEEFYLQEALTASKLGKKVKLSKTRVLGCEIARN